MQHFRVSGTELVLSQYHYDLILTQMKLAAGKLPKIEAVGGSETGTITDSNEAAWCGIFTNVPADLYKEKVANIFMRMAADLAGPSCPLKVFKARSQLLRLSRRSDPEMSSTFPWAAAREQYTRTAMAASRAGSTNSAMSNWT